MANIQDFLRRNFYIVNLGLIAIGAYLFAGVVTEFAATAIFKRAGAASPGKIDSPAQVSVLPKPPESLMAITRGRNPFDAEPIIKTEESPESATEQQLEDIGVDLLGILVSSRPEWSMAMIRTGGEVRLVRIGSMVQDRAEVVEIQSRYLRLRIGESQKVVKLWAAKTAEQKQIAALPRPVPFSPQPQEPSPDFSKGVKKVGPYEYHIDRALLDENLRDLTKLGMEARIIPNYVDGKYQGFRVVGIRPDSLYRAIGLESGDLVTRVNGQDIDTPNKAIQLFEELRNSPTITLDIERRGQKVTLTYKVK